MFANVGWGEMLMLLVVGLVVLGPERLPGAIRWTSGAVKQARDYVSGATSQLREDFGPEFEDFREPLNDLNKLRGMTPRAAITKHLLDGDDSIFSGKFDVPAAPKPVSPGGPEAVETPEGTPAAELPATQPAPGPAKFDSDAT